jgi:cytochrome c biogenesis protein
MAEDLRNLSRRFWQTLSSIKTGVVLLIMVVIIAAAGTLILQRPVTEADEMQRAYSPQVLRLLDATGLTDVFHAWWFLLLMGLVSLSIVAASIDRFPRAWKFVARPYRNTDEHFRRALSPQKQFAVEDAAGGLAAAESILRKQGWKPQLIRTGGQVSLFAERGLIAEFAVYLVHASLLLIFVGGIVDGIYGWRGFVSLEKGAMASSVALHDGTNRPLPFAIRCDGAGQENYADGTPKRWWSKLAVMDNGRETVRKEIVVNDPLVYHNVRFYQASYGSTGKLDTLVLAATAAGKTSGAQEISLAVGQEAKLDEETSVRLAEFIPDYVVRDGQVYTRSADVQNPAAHLVVTTKSGAKVNFWLPALPGFAENTNSPYQFEAKDLRLGYFTGLEVSHEPGQWAVWAGVVLMGLGLACVFYLVHTRIWATVLRNPTGELRIWLGGAANRNKDVFEGRFQQLTAEIESELKTHSLAATEAHTLVVGI